MMITYSPVCHIDGRADREEIMAAIKASMEKDGARLEKLWINGVAIPARRPTPAPACAGFWKRLARNLRNAWELTRQGY